MFCEMNKLLFTLLFIATNTNAGIFDSKLQYYSCPNMESANQCNSSCTKEKGYEIEPKVNKNASIVMVAKYQDGKVDGSWTEENCKIIDAKNWSCTYESQRIFSSAKMVSGQYSSYVWTTMPNKTSSQSHACAK